MQKVIRYYLNPNDHQLLSLAVVAPGVAMACHIFRLA